MSNIHLQILFQLYAIAAKVIYITYNYKFSMASPEAVVQVFCKKAALKTCAELTGKHRCWSLFLIKFQGFQPCKLIKKRLRERCLFSCESCEIFKNTYFGERLQNAAFAYQILHSVKQHCRIRRQIQLNSKRKKFSLKVKVLNLN